MGLLKRTYSLQAEMLEEFEEKVKPGGRSAVIGEVLREWLNAQERERLRQEVIEGCKDMADVYLKTEQEYHLLEEEAARVIQVRSAKRRYRRSATRSR